MIIWDTSFIIIFINRKSKEWNEIMLEDNIKNSLYGIKANVSVVLKDLSNDKWLYRLDEHRQIPSASTIKILIMIEAFNQAMKGKFSLGSKIAVKDGDKVPSSIITDLDTDCYTLMDLITLMIITSDNTATNMLIDKLGFESINQMADFIGLSNTRLQRKMMDFDAVKRGYQNLTSAMDMAVMMELIHKGDVVGKEACEAMLRILKKQRDKTMLARYLPGDTVIAHKTGDLPFLNHDIGIFYTPGSTYLLGVFVTEAESNLMAQRIIGNISKNVYEYKVAVNE